MDEYRSYAWIPDLFRSGAENNILEATTNMENIKQKANRLLKC